MVDGMWTYENHQTTAATRPSIWSLYGDVSRWPDWDDAMDRVDLNGPFAVGTEGVMHVKNFGPIPFTLTVVDAPTRFVTRTPMEGFDIIFDHGLTAENGTTTIAHWVTIEGPAADIVGPQMGPNITTDIPHAISKIAELALMVESNGA
jgi:hypothetical protein